MDFSRRDFTDDHAQARAEAGVTETCALDVAARGEHTLDEIGTLLGVSRQGVQQIEARAMAKVKRALGRLKAKGEL